MVVTVTEAVKTKVGTTLLLTPSGTVIVGGTLTTAGLLLEKETKAPAAGAGAVNGCPRPGNRWDRRQENHRQCHSTPTTRHACLPVMLLKLGT